MSRINRPRKTKHKVGDLVFYKGRKGVIINQWGGLLGCPQCTQLIATDEKKTPCCRRKPITAHCEDVFDVFIKGKGVVSIHASNFEETPPVTQKDLNALKRRMESATAAFHRIPQECELDGVECDRRRVSMIKAKAEYFAAKGLVR